MNKMETNHPSEISANRMKLFSPEKIGHLNLKHRVAHPPLTRLRANPDDGVSNMVIKYYTQRASDGGFIITESTHPSFDSRGYIGAPGNYEDHHIAGWKKVIDAVHHKGGLIFMQISHDGRQSHESLKNGKPPIAPSVVPFEGLSFTAKGWVPVTQHRAVDISESPELVETVRKAAERALIAGFDGVELHNANGYLADIFLQDGTNKRTDAYGGSIEKRVKFPLELVGHWYLFGEQIMLVYGGRPTVNEDIKMPSAMHQLAFVNR